MRIYNLMDWMKNIARIYRRVKYMTFSHMQDLTRYPLPNCYWIIL